MTEGRLPVREGMMAVHGAQVLYCLAGYQQPTIFANIRQETWDHRCIMHKNDGNE